MWSDQPVNGWSFLNGQLTMKDGALHAIVGVRCSPENMQYDLHTQ